MLLIYGHDVCAAADPLQEWYLSRPPAQPSATDTTSRARRGGRQGTVRTPLLESPGRLLQDARNWSLSTSEFSIEGEEEVGRRTHRRYVAADPDRSKADAALSAIWKCSRWSCSTITTGLRGLVDMELKRAPPRTIRTGTGRLGPR